MALFEYDDLLLVLYRSFAPRVVVCIFLAISVTCIGYTIAALSIVTATAISLGSFPFELTRIKKS